MTPLKKIDGFIERALEIGRETITLLDMTLGAQILTSHFLEGFSTGMAALGLWKTPLIYPKTAIIFKTK